MYVKIRNFSYIFISLLHSKYESFLFTMRSWTLEQDFNSSRNSPCIVIYRQILYPPRFSLKNLHMRPINFTLCRQWLSRHSILECQRYSLHVWTPRITHGINKKLDLYITFWLKKKLIAIGKVQTNK